MEGPPNLRALAREPHSPCTEGACQGSHHQESWNYEERYPCSRAVRRLQVRYRVQRYDSPESTRREHYTVPLGATYRPVEVEGNLFLPQDEPKRRVLEI